MTRWLKAFPLQAGMAALALTVAAAPEASATEWPAPGAHGHALRHDHIGQLDHSGRMQMGLASYYAPHFTGRKMANGKRFNPNAAVAASMTLPLGTTARVTNLQNGLSVIVSIEDRGPHIAGRVVDVAPRVAKTLGMKRHGVVPVLVIPLTVPQPDGTVKPGMTYEETADLRP